MLQILKLAGRVARSTDPDDPRNFHLGSIGIRKDGVIVSAKNGAVYSTQTDNYQLLPDSHAEGRVLRKLGHGGDLYVTRVAKLGGYAMAMPCPMCQVRIKSFNVRKVFYTINSTQYGMWDVKRDVHRVYGV